MDARKLRILQAIIDDYILTAAPVGSRTISKRADIGLSPATIRNEMSDLEEMGYLEQPHTSAGRVPSDKAYRLYVDSLMRRARLSEPEASYIKNHYSKKLGEVEEVIKQTAWVLSSVTHYTSMVLPPRINSIRLKYIHIVPVGSGRALVIIVTDTGITKDSLIRIPQGMTIETLERLSKTLTARFCNCKLDEVTLEGFATLSGELSEEKEFFDEMLRSIQKTMTSGGNDIELSGTTNMLAHPEYSDVEKARALLNTIEQKGVLYKLLSEATDLEFSISIGKENDVAMQDCSIVTATYKIGSTPMGSFGVIGPTRMDYAKVLAVVGQIGVSLSEVLTNMFEEERR